MTETAEERVKALEKELEGVRNEGRVWAKQRSVLVHNLASVVKTAKAEILRKDGEIGKSKRV